MNFVEAEWPGGRQAADGGGADVFGMASEANRIGDAGRTYVHDNLFVRWRIHYGDLSGLLTHARVHQQTFAGLSAHIDTVSAVRIDAFEKRFKSAGVELARLIERRSQCRQNAVNFCCHESNHFRGYGAKPTRPYGS
jgi:hypothetical protein